MIRNEEEVQLVELNRLNWHKVIDIQLDEYQKQFIPSPLYCIAQSAFEKNAKRYGIEYEGKIVGLLIVLFSPPICWLTRIMVDLPFQGKGIGGKAVKQLITELSHTPRFREIRATVARENARGAQFFQNLGFEFHGMIDDEEIVFVYLLHR